MSGFILVLSLEKNLNSMVDEMYKHRVYNNTIQKVISCFRR